MKQSLSVRGFIAFLVAALAASLVSGVGPATAQDALTCNGLTPTIVGTSDDDEIDGTAGDDVILGLGGNDTIKGKGGNDTVCGGDGDDKLESGPESVWFDGGDGNNEIKTGDGDDIILAGPDDDKIEAGAGDNTIDAGDGKNDIKAEDGKDQVTAGSGGDKIDVKHGDNTIDAGDGNNEVKTGDGDDDVTTGAGVDKIEVKNGTDRVSSGDGDDEIKAEDGAAVIDAGPGDDKIETKKGDDVVFGGPGDDEIKTGDGDDQVNGGDGDDLIKGENGDDALDGGNDIDIVEGGNDIDTCDDAETTKDCETITNNGEPDPTVVPVLVLTGPEVVPPVSAVITVTVAAEELDLDGVEVRVTAGSTELGVRTGPGELAVDTRLLSDGQVGLFAQVEGPDGLLFSQPLWVTVSNNPDSDGDGVPDQLEIELGIAGEGDDQDGDGLTDLEELAAGTDPNVADAGGDDDGDGLSNADEVEAGTRADIADSDGDGQDDNTEIATGSDPRQPDTDGDGLLDSVEAANGFDPLNPDSNGDGIADGEETYTAPPVSIDGISVQVTGTGNPGLGLLIDTRDETLFVDESSLSPVFDIELRNSTLDTAELTLDYNVSELPIDGSPAVFYWVADPGVWVPAQLPDDQIINPLAGTVTATVDHFSIYSVRDVNAWGRRFTTTACVGGEQLTPTSIGAAPFDVKREIADVAIAGDQTWVGTNSDYVGTNQTVYKPSLKQISAEGAVTTADITYTVDLGGFTRDYIPRVLLDLIGADDGSVFVSANQASEDMGFQLAADGTLAQHFGGFDGLPGQPLSAAVNDQGLLRTILASPSGFPPNITTLVDVGPHQGTGFFGSGELKQPVGNYRSLNNLGLYATSGITAQGSTHLFADWDPTAPEGARHRVRSLPDGNVEFIVTGTHAITDLASSPTRLAALRGDSNSVPNVYELLDNNGTLLAQRTIPFAASVSQAVLFDGTDSPYLGTVSSPAGGLTTIRIIRVTDNQTVATVRLDFTPTGPVGIDYNNGTIAIAAEAAGVSDTLLTRLDNPARFSTIRVNPIDIDTDGDGLPDCVETGGWEANGDTLTSDPNLPNSDSDTLTDGQETLLLTAEDMSALPNVNLPADYFKTAVTELVDGVALVIPYSNPREADTDGDGLNDTQERNAGTDAFLPDTDGDGSPDWAEIDRGTDPLVDDDEGAYALAFQPVTVRTGARAASCVENGGNVFLDEPIWVGSRGEHVSGCWYIEDCIPTVPLIGGLQKWSCNNQSGLRKALVASIAVSVVLACVATACYVVAGPAAGSLAAQAGAAKVATLGGTAAIGTGFFAVTTSSELVGTAVILGAVAAAQAVAGAELNAGFDLAESFDRSVNRILELQPGTDPELARELVRRCQDSKIAEQAERLGKFDRAGIESITSRAYRAEGMTAPSGILTNQGGQHACELLPIYFPGEVSVFGAPQWQTTQHQREALGMASRESVFVGNPPDLQSFTGVKTNPLWVALTRRTGPRDARLVDWVNNGCTQTPDKGLRGIACDEFPFNRTYEGRWDAEKLAKLPIGRFSESIVASLKDTDLSETSHGIDLNAFYDRCSVGDQDAFGIVPLPRIRIPGLNGFPPDGDVLPTMSLRFCPTPTP